MDWFCAEGNRSSFALFNDVPLSDEPVTIEDLQIVETHGPDMEAARAATWSSDADWFFVILNDCIVLGNTKNTSGVICQKKSYRFIEFWDEALTRVHRQPKRRTV